MGEADDTGMANEADEQVINTSSAIGLMKLNSNSLGANNGGSGNANGGIKASASKGANQPGNTLNQLAKNFFELIKRGNIEAVMAEIRKANIDVVSLTDDGFR